MLSDVPSSEDRNKNVGCTASDLCKYIKHTKIKIENKVNRKLDFSTYISIQTLLS